MNNTSIEWTDQTDNPIRVKGGGFYCVKVSEGCKHCYAETMNHRFHPELPMYQVGTVPELELKEEILNSWVTETKKWMYAHLRKKRTFVTSMTDLFAEFVPEEWVFAILQSMCWSTTRIFQVLTKRSARMRELVDEFCTMEGIERLPDHIILMVSVENQERAVERIGNLVNTKCSKRGLSVEPLLDSLNLKFFCDLIHVGTERKFVRVLEHMDWVIVGGESGTQARKPKTEWFRQIQKDCAAARVPFFFKQHGKWVPMKHMLNKDRLIEANHMLDGVTYQNFPEGL